MTVKDATKIAFDQMPETFHILMLCRKVNGITHRSNLMDGTITRKLRELREDERIRYRLTNKARSFYCKNDQLNLEIK